MATKLQIRRDTAANWTSANPTLSSGEFGYETDTYKLKIGDGSTAWTSLDYYADQLAGGLDSSQIVGLLSNGSVGHIIPAGNELYDLGDSANRFRDLYLSGSTLNLGNATLSADSAGTLTLPSTIKIGTTTLQETSSGVTIGDSGGTILDSAAVLSFINAAYIQANQITYNTNDFADSAFVTSQINALVDGAPGTLDTLNEIAAALNDDAAAYDTLLSLINAKTDYDSADTLGLIDSAYIQARQTTASSGVDSAAVTALIDSAYVQARQTSGGSGTVDSSQVISIINNNTNSGFYKYKYTATAGQTVFADSDANGNVMSFDPNSTLVFYNGVLLDETTDYEASSNTVTLTSGADAGVSITVAKYGVGYTPPDVVWGGDRGIFAGGYTGSSRSNVIQYFDITTPSNTTDFGDMSSGRNNVSGTSSTTRGLILGGYNGSSNENTIEYVTIASPGNTSDFGDLTFAENAFGSMSDGTYAAFARYNSGYDGIQYVTIATTGNAQNFGNMNVNRTSVVGCSNNTYGIICGGSATPATVMDYITMATPGNASDFGDMLVGSSYRAAASDATRGVISGGNTSTDMEYITTTTPSNGVDFGDLTQARNAMAACSNETRAVFSSGQSGSNYYNTMDYVTIQTLGNAADFGDLVSAIGYGASFAGAAA